MYRSALFSLLVIGLNLSPTAYADEDNLSPFVQELLLSNSGDNQELGEWQWAVSSQYLDLEQSKMSMFSTELEYGITSRFTLGLELPYAYIKPERGNSINGLGNIELSALYRLLEQDDYYLSIAVEKSFDTAAEDIAESQEDGWELDLIYLRQVAYNHQLKASFITEFEDDENSHQVTVAWMYNLAEVATAVELSRYDSVENDELESSPEQAESSDDAWQVALSAVWQYDDDQEIQLGMPIGLSGDIADWGLTLNWSVEWE